MKRGIKTVLIWGLLLGVMFYALFNQNGNGDSSADETAVVYISSDDSLEMIDDGRVDGYRMDNRGLLLFAVDGQVFVILRPLDPSIFQHLKDAQLDYFPDFDPAESSESNVFVFVFVGIIGLLALFYFLRKMGGSGGGMNNIFELRKTKARAVDEVDKAQFSDIGGNHEAVELLADIVDFLRAPKRWLAAGTRIPRGVLVVGPPGTGKTLLARAVAGETQSAFFYTSASEFVELFVGVGAARVRDTFEKAAAAQPAVIFIDELDAIGRRRGSGSGAMHEEREQTLNQLLVLMDGLEQHAQLVVMAATNRPDILDPALLRSGRFDRMLRLEAPAKEDRIAILKIHTRNKPIDASVSLEQISQRTDGFTGADLEALTNDAALMAVRRSRDGRNGSQGSVSLTRDDFNRALETMTRSNRQFDRLDSVLVESVSQFAEPTGRAVARITLTTGTTVEGDVLWMNAAHIKLRSADGSEVIIAKEMAEQIVSLKGTEWTPTTDFTPDPWAGKNLDVG